MFNLGEMWILALNPTILRHNDARLRYCANQIYPEAGNGELFVLCYFGGLSMRGFEVIKGSLWCPPPFPRSQEEKNALSTYG